MTDSNLPEGFEFDEPPTGRPTWGKWAARLSPLKSHPGDWVRVEERSSLQNAQTAAGNIKYGRLSGVPRGEFEARGGTKDGKHYVWVRYVGGES